MKKVRILIIIKEILRMKKLLETKIFINERECLFIKRKIYIFFILSGI